MTYLGDFSQESQGLWLSKDDLKDPSSWSSSPLLLLRDIHSRFLSDYNCDNCKETSSQSQVNVGDSGGLKDGVSHPQDPLSLPLCEMRTLSPTMLLLPSPHIIGSPNRYSTTGIPSLTSNLCFRTRVTLNS